MENCAESGWPVEIMISFPKTLVSSECRCWANVLLYLQNVLNVLNISAEMSIFLHFVFLTTILFQFFVFHKFVQINLLLDNNSWRGKCNWLFSLFNLDPGWVCPNFQDV